jgi:diacylglycerol kinase (ATP)
MKLNNIVIANPNAANGKVLKHLTEISEKIKSIFGNIDVKKTQHPGHATEIVRESLKNGIEKIIILGGDGSINEAVNGFFDDKGNLLNKTSTLSILPVGTGNDFCRTIGLFKLNDIDKFKNASTKEVDVGLLKYTNDNGVVSSRYFINAMSLGCSGHIAQTINNKSKSLGPKLTYFLGTIKGMMEYKNKLISMKLDDEHDRKLNINTLVVGNARYWAGSMKISPYSIIDDGLLDVVIAENISLKDFLLEGRKIYKGTHLENDKLKWVRAKKIQIELTNQEDEIFAEADGEQMGKVPLSIEVIPKAIKIFSPWELAEQ